ncbi:Delta(14)-sterol reductase [Zea mays]|uniref:Delta(14)-sterol reductase n=1 Tax=Zea mays TaxID=4577 RepID=A0A1D6F1V7_MAIZE|nr:Delta(14)-sterol reductase [Zea mays]
MEAAAAVLPTLVPSGSAVVSRRSSLATVVPLVCCGLLHMDRSLCTCVLALCCAGGGAPRLPRVSRRRWSHPPREARRRSPTPGLLSPPLSLQRYLLLPLFPESSGQPAELFDRLPLILVWLAGLLSLLLLLGLSAFGVYMGWMSPTVVADMGLELLSVTFIFSVIVSFALYIAGIKSGHKSSSLRPHVSGSFMQDWWFGVQLNPHFMEVDLKWDIIAERLGFMLVFGDLVFIPFTFTIQVSYIPANVDPCYLVFRGANKQKHVFKKDPKAPIWGKPPKVVGGKLLASGYWGIARHCNYLGDLLLALSFSLPCGVSSVVPYFYPTYLLILLVLRERRDEARCSQKYREIWAEYCKLVPWRILPYVY